MHTGKITRIFAGALFALALAACAGSPKQESTGEYIDDTALTAKVKAALVNDPMVSALAVNVETFKGTVQLSGFVKSAAERERAHKVAHTVSGVTRVRNDIIVR